jgi:hypothetical protein
MTTAQPGDVVIRQYVGDSLQLIDVATQEQIAIVPSLEYALRMAAERNCAIWREPVDARTAGTPHLILLKPRGE